MIRSLDEIVDTYREANPRHTVPFALFRSRIMTRLNRGKELPDNHVHDALYLDTSDYRRKYGSRKTYVAVKDESVELNDFFAAIPKPTVSYRTFYQRTKRLEEQSLVDISTLEQAATLSSDEWTTFFGGGRRRRFEYQGFEYLEHIGREFSSITAFLRAIGKYGERSTIWARLKRGWDLDDAIIEPVLPLDDRSGLIYLVICNKSRKQYVGLTRMTPEQRWRHHVRTALEGRSKAPLAKAIRKWGVTAFSVNVLEEGLNQEELPERETYWIRKLNTNKPKGFNARPGGQMGGGKGRSIEYEEETFPSLESAAAALSVRTGIARHVVLRRISRGEKIPKRARSTSKHPEAGTNLWRRWKSLLNAVAAGRRNGTICKRWENYDSFASDVRDGYRSELKLIRIDDSKPWGPRNVKWVTAEDSIAATHGTAYVVHGQTYLSLNAVARAYGIGRSTLKNRLEVQGLPIDEAVTRALGPTSATSRMEPMIVDGRAFPSINQSAKFTAGYTIKGHDSY